MFSHDLLIVVILLLCIVILCNIRLSIGAEQNEMKEIEKDSKKMRMDTLISNDLSDGGGVTQEDSLQYRIFVRNIMMYEIQRPINVQFRTEEIYETASCLNFKDEAVLNDVFALLNDLVKGNASHTIYNAYKTDLKLQKILHISGSTGNRIEEFAKKQKLALFYILQILRGVIGSPATYNIYDVEWDRPVFYRLQSLRVHLIRALRSALLLSTQDTMRNSAGEISCKKYVQIQTLIPVVTACLNQFAECAGNNFRATKLGSCIFNFTFADTYFANLVQRENDQKMIVSATKLLEESMSFRSSNGMHTDMNSHSMEDMLNTKSPKDMKTFMSKKPKVSIKDSFSSSSSVPKADEADTAENEGRAEMLSKSRQENIKVADMEVNDVLHEERKLQPIFNKDIMPVIVGEINMLYATEIQYEVNSIVHDDNQWYILIDAKLQDRHEGWTPIPYLNQQFAIEKGYMKDDIVVYGDKVHILDDVENQNIEKGWLQVAYGKDLQSASNVDKEVHTNLPFIYGEYDPIFAASNKYAANSIVYVEESGTYYILINQRHQIDERSWEAIQPMKEDLVSESKYKANDLVVYKNTVLLLKSPFNQLEPTSWIEIPINGNKINENMKKSDGVDAIQRKILLAKRKLIYEIEKAKKVEEDEKPPGER